MKNHSLLTLSIATIIASFTLNSITPSAFAAETSITIYSSMQGGAIQPQLYRPMVGGIDFNQYNTIPGYAMVRQKREITLNAERDIVSLDDVAAYIDPTTVSFKSITDPSTTVLEQSYMFDLVSPQKLAERYLGETIQVEKRLTDNTAPEMIHGKLISIHNGTLTLQQTDGSIIMANPNDAIFPKLPNELYIKPTLVWDIRTKQLGKHTAELSYQTEGVTWWADYNAIYSEGKDANSGFLDLGAWVSIVNKSGASYHDATLKLVAGEVNQVQPQAQTMYARKNVMMEMAAAPMEDDTGFVEKSLFEYHLYTLGRPTTLPVNSTKQLELFSKANQIPVVKELVFSSSDMRYYGGMNYNEQNEVTQPRHATVFLKFRNDKEHGLGLPLPAGRLRVSQLDTQDGSLEFIGEDMIGHTPKDEDLTLKLGEAFDVVGERKQTAFFIDHQRKTMDESFEIKIRNHKQAPVTVKVLENLYRGSNWSITKTSDDFKNDDANTIHYNVMIPKDGEKIIHYTVHYTWR